MSRQGQGWLLYAAGVVLMAAGAGWAQGFETGLGFLGAGCVIAALVRGS